VGLAEAITQQHGPNGPNTHNWGQNPIDAIFLPTDIIQSVNSGYLAFGEGIPSDHCAMWIDIPLAALGWFQTPELILIRARRLKGNDPHIVARYNEVLQENKFPQPNRADRNTNKPNKGQSLNAKTAAGI